MPASRKADLPTSPKPMCCPGGRFPPGPLLASVQRRVSPCVPPPHLWGLYLLEPQGSARRFRLTNPPGQFGGSYPPRPSVALHSRPTPATSFPRLYGFMKRCDCCSLSVNFSGAQQPSSLAPRILHPPTILGKHLCRAPPPRPAFLRCRLSLRNL